MKLARWMGALALAASLVAPNLALAGPTLLVGHSNTVPELVKLLGGAAGAPIADNEFDRLYQVMIAADGSVTTVLLTTLPAP